MRVMFRVAWVMIAAAWISFASASPMVAAGTRHSAAVGADGYVRTWGDDATGQLGVGAATFIASPTRIASLPSLRQVAVGCSHSLGLAQDGGVFAWGGNARGQLGDGTRGDRPTPVPVAGLSGIVQVAAGCYGSLAIGAGGQVWQWGQLNGTTTISERPVQVAGLVGAVSVAIGASVSAAVTSDGQLWTWGAAALGEGSPQFGGLQTAVPIRIGLPAPAAAVSCAFQGATHWCLALMRDGTVASWGSNNGYSVLGDGRTGPSNVPARIPALASIEAVSAGPTHGLALRSDGAVLAWGRNEFAQLGDGTTAIARATPLVVEGLAPAASVAAGPGHSLARLRDGTLRAWGNSRFGELGDGRTVASAHPIVAGPAAAIAAIAAGGSVDVLAGGFSVDVTTASSLAVLSDGSPWAWGSNKLGQLGVDRAITRTTPSRMDGLPGITAVAAGGAHTLALRNDGLVFAWGSNSRGQLGDGTATDRSRFGPVVGLLGLSAIAAGGNHSVALKPDGSVYTWGMNASAQLGTGNRRDRAIPGPVSTASGSPMPALRAIAAGGDHTIGLAADGIVWGWGSTFQGALGVGAPRQGGGYAQPSAAPIVGFDQIVAIAAGSDSTVALRRDGTVWVLGAPINIPIGVPYIARTTPTQVRGITDATAISADAALRADGSVWRWEPDGPNGNSGLVARPLPGFIGVAAIPQGMGGARLALRPGGTVLAIGANDRGQLGDGTLVARTAAVSVVREGGGGSIETNDWFLDLDPAAAAVATAPPVFLVNARGADNVVAADIRFRAGDVGSSASVFVFALAPADLVAGARSLDGMPVAKDTPVPCVLAQLNASGQLQGVTAANLQAAVTNVLSSQGQAVQVLNGVATANVAGATFFVGYGASGSAMVNGGVNRSVVSVPGTRECKPEAPQPGWWWNPLEDGRGFSIEKRGANLFFAAFLYDVSGRSTWYVSSGPVSLDGALYSGALYGARGGQALGGAYPGRPSLSDEGLVTLSFDTASTGTMIWPGGTVPIQRFDIVPNGLATGPAAAMPETGWWWNESESGRGFFMEWQGTSLDIAGYMYDDAGNSVWYLTVGEQSADGKTFTGSWWSYGNGQTLTGAWKPNARLSTTVAPLTITFSGPDTALMTLPNGRSTALTRHRF